MEVGHCANDRGQPNMDAATEAEQLVKDLLAMDEPWRSRFLDLVGDLASADRPDGTQPAREEILGWLADQEICRQVHLLLIAWKG